VVDITRCERCGKVIPALDTGCAYCDARDAERGGFTESVSLARPIRLLLWLFVANLVSSGTLAIFTLVANSEAEPGRSTIAILASSRLLLSFVTTLGILFREPWGRFLPLVFLGFEFLSLVLVSAGAISISHWIGGWLSPVWNLLFLFLFLRDDVQAWLDPQVADRREVGALLEELERDRSRSRD
jgi:hypothetical protein